MLKREEILRNYGAKRPINEQEILRLIELDDLSECDSDEGGEFASHISTPSDSYLTLPDDVLVEKRLEEIFGIDNELHEDSPPDTGYDNEGSLYDDLQPIFSEIDQLDDQFPSSTPEQSTTPLQSSSTVQSSILASRPSTSHDIVFQRNARSTNNNAKPRSWKMLRKVPKIPNFDKKITSVTASPITAIKWLDTREVTVLTTAHQPRDTTFVKRTQKNGSRQEVLCPKAIADYTLSMGGVDSTRGRHVPLAGPSPFFHVATCYTSASASPPHQFMRIRMQMRMSKLMRMFRMCGCGCEYSQHP
ncbi:hypothetical protein EVAR_14206_1 [Eumeta japonica]|uniref:PiggyBac transposable element-derived protein domain-containing protein n=1 Tax=Eumeta variegata TaxID=151549 RepID=A0A4C1UFW9_EUMVA|nr:hypothetical protein EVAR_14206_1 [Eumeta japonica]